MRERTDTIVERWAGEVLSSYSSEAAVFFHKQQDPFSNPIGHSVREGTRGAFQAIRDGMDLEELRSHLDRILRVRAVQDFAPSQALSFVFSLRSIIRDVIPELDADPRTRREVAELDDRIDRAALVAFDIYAERREELSRLRVNEVKRQVAWVFEKMNQRDAAASGPEGTSDLTAAVFDNVQREDLR
ncbi:MAG: RsbRD N-terminal domain-containing protein [Longimicrobiales bacterium]